MTSCALIIVFISHSVIALRMRWRGCIMRVLNLNVRHRWVSSDSIDFSIIRASPAIALLSRPARPNSTTTLFINAFIRLPFHCIDTFRLA